MKTIPNNRIFQQILLLAFLSVNLQAQQREADSLLKAAVIEVYNNPAHAIEIANTVYKNSGANSKIKIKSLMAMAQANVMLTHYENVLQNADEALQIARETNDYTNQIVINNFLGNHYFRLELKDKAWQSLKIAEDLIVQHPPADSLVHLKGNVYLLKGYLYADKLDCNYASIYFDKAIECFEKSRDKEFSNINLGVVYTHKGRCLMESGQLAEAEKCFRKAVAISSGNNNIGVNVFSRLSLSQVFARQKQFSQSNTLLLETLKTAKTANQRELVKEIYHQLADNYLGLNDIKKHAQYNQLYNQSVAEFDKSESQSVNQIARAVSAKNDDESAGQDDQSNRIFLICGGLLLLIIGVFLLVFKLKRKIKRQE